MADGDEVPSALPEPGPQQLLEYARPAVSRPPPRFLRWVANLCLGYPLFFLACFYGHWLLAWYVLGHRPRPSLDDPKDIPHTDLLYVAAALSLVALLPMGLAMIASNVTYLTLARPGPALTARRVLFAVVVWLGAMILVRSDPGRVLYWFMD